MKTIPEKITQYRREADTSLGAAFIEIEELMTNQPIRDGCTRSEIDQVKRAKNRVDEIKKKLDDAVARIELADAMQAAYQAGMEDGPL